MLVGMRVDSLEPKRLDETKKKPTPQNARKNMILRLQC